MHQKIEPKTNMKAAFDACRTLSKRPGDFFIAFADTNSLKRVNDFHGHLVGDKVIDRVAELLATGIREEDRIIRFGGDEFVLFLPNINPSSVTEFISRIQERISSDRFLIDLVGPVFVSIGVVRFDQMKHTTVEAAVHDSDLLMYAAKGKAPKYLAISGSSEGLEKKDSRRRDAASVRRRQFFSFVVDMVALEVENPDKAKIIQSAREIWRINGGKVLNGESTNAVINLVKRIYEEKNKKSA